MPYVDGPNAGGYEPIDELPARDLVGYLKRDGGAVLHATRYGRRSTKKVGPNGLVSLAEAAALLHRRDPDTGELRAFSRIATYQWARGGTLPTVVGPRRKGTRPITQVRLSDLRRYARAKGYEFLPADDAAAR